MYLGLAKCVFKVYLNWFSVYIGLVKLNVYLGLFLCIWVLFRVYLELVEGLFNAYLGLVNVYLRFI